MFAIITVLNNPVCHTPFTRWSWLNELALPANMKLARRAGLWRLLDVCSMFAWFLLRTGYALCMLHICLMFARRSLNVCSMFAWSCKRGIRRPNYYNGHQASQPACWLDCPTLYTLCMMGLSSCTSTGMVELWTQERVHRCCRRTNAVLHGHQTQHTTCGVNNIHASTLDMQSDSNTKSHRF